MHSHCMMTRNLKRLQNGKDKVIKCIQTVWNREKEWQRRRQSERIKQILYCRTHGKKVEGIWPLFGTSTSCLSDKFHMYTHIAYISFTCACVWAHIKYHVINTHRMATSYILIFALIQQQILWAVFHCCMIIIQYIVVVRSLAFYNKTLHVFESLVDIFLWISVAHVRIIIISLFFCWLTTVHHIFSSFTSFHDHHNGMNISFLVHIFKQLYLHHLVLVMGRRYCWWWAPVSFSLYVIMLGAKWNRQT